MTSTVASIAALVGNTPLIKIDRITRDTPSVEIFAKLEYFNPGGSVKDRAAMQMVRDALEDGRFEKGKTLIDSTSGNTGIALSWIGAALGFPVALVMPSNVSLARKQITAGYGAQLIYSDPLEGSDGAIRHVRREIAEHPDRYFYPDQYSNPSNPRAHYLTTAPELWAQTRGKITHFVAGLGTSGTVMGTGRRLKELNPAIQIVAVEPAEPMHGLEGLKHMASSILPGIYSPAGFDQKRSITTDAGWDMTDRLLAEEGLAVGHSSGAAMAGAFELAQELSRQKQTGLIVAVFCDRADRYFEPGRAPRRFPF